MLLCVAAWCLAAQGVAAPDFVLSPTGDDTGPGSQSKPFRTLDRARNAVRELRQAQPNRKRPVRVLLESGTYELPHTFELTPQDSGTAESPTEYVGDSAVISGGREITGFQTDHNFHWTVQVDDVRNGKWRFSQLFVNGQRRNRPRMPAKEYFNIASEVPPTPGAKGHGFDRFGFQKGDIDPSWHNIDDVELLCFHTWDMSRMRIASVSTGPEGNVVTTTAPTGFDAPWASFPKGNRFLVENVREALDKPGEWYLDTRTGVLTYDQVKGEAMGHMKFEAPRLEKLIEIKGDIAAHRYVRNVNFSGLSLTLTNWNLPKAGRFAPQAEADLGAAFEATGWRNGNLTDTRIYGVGEYGVQIGGGCQNVTVDGCEFTDLGAGGVKIGETKMYDDESDAAHDITVQNCLIAHGGRIHPAAIGVWIGQSWNDTVSHNDIYDLYYTGISDGWTWGYGKSEAHNNHITYNHIHDIGQGVLSDMGGIYTLGVQPGTEIVGNRIHDVNSFSYGGWGIYPDEGSSHELIENNVVYGTKSGSFHQHYGQENIVRNNVFAYAREAEIIRTRAEDHLSFTFEHNIVLWKDAPLLGSNWTGNNYQFNNNVYWRTDQKPVDFAGMTLEQWRAKGQDENSVVADPMFEDVVRGFYRVKPGSPALKLGFYQIDETLAGRPHTGGLALDPPTPMPAFPIVKS